MYIVFHQPNQVQMPDLSMAPGILVLALIVLMTNPKSVAVIDAAVGEHADRYLEAKRPRN